MHQPEEITLKRENPFFIAIACNENSLHHFILAGTLSENGKPIILARVAKRTLIAYLLNFLKNFLVSRAPSMIIDESVHIRGKVYYTAYEISYEQYEQFLVLLRKIHKSNTKLFNRYKNRGDWSDDSTTEEDMLSEPLNLYRSKNIHIVDREPSLYAYLPYGSVNGGSEILFQYGGLSSLLAQNPSAEEERLIVHTLDASMTNSCRHSAKEIVAAVTERPLPLSSSYLSNLTASARFSYGNLVSGHFFVLPLPPPDNAVNKVVLIKIYKRMEKLIQYHPDDPKTIEKFEALKELYKEQSTLVSEDFTQAMQRIRDWKQRHPVISQHRFWLSRLINHKTATDHLVDETIAEYAKLAQRSL